MSMIGNFRQVTEADLKRLIQDPSSIEDFLYPPEGGGGTVGMDVDKAWQGIHFLLTGQAFNGDPPLADVICGGVEFGDDVGYGPARYLTAAEVRQVADAIRPITSAELAKRFDAKAMEKNDIYPGIWDEGDEARNYLLHWYEILRDYYFDAASKNNAMLLYLN